MDEGDAPWQTKVQVMGSLNFNVWRLQVAVEGKGFSSCSHTPFPPKLWGFDRGAPLEPRHQENLPSRRKWCFTQIEGFLHTFQWFIQQKIWDVQWMYHTLWMLWIPPPIQPHVNPPSHSAIGYPKIPWFGPENAPVSFLAIFGHPQFSTKPKAYDFVLHEL